MSNIDVDSKRFIFHLMVGNRAVGMSENMRGQVVNTGLLKEKVLLLFQPKSREGRGRLTP